MNRGYISFKTSHSSPLSVSDSSQMTNQQTAVFPAPPFSTGSVCCVQQGGDSFIGTTRNSLQWKLKNSHSNVCQAELN